ncbi:hypothetical protein P7K49_020372 [Saguinus oedipus]|uniref:Uncharacterized protein n=1 Tax=Saguinus oedipus TaxID=9490 RepID=A0ABQ9V0Z7_SAGOE|nr:hypothetical protein P7K49_020372 [Saguinus oedipus]
MIFPRDVQIITADIHVGSGGATTFHSSLVSQQPWKEAARCWKPRASSGRSLENLEYNVEPQEISHPDVGRYFSEFTGTHYIPNAELEIRYPEDLEFVYETVQNIYSAKKENIDE